MGVREVGCCKAPGLPEWPMCSGNFRKRKSLIMTSIFGNTGNVQ